MFSSGTAMEEHAWTHPIFCMLGQEMLHQQDYRKVLDILFVDIPYQNMVVGVTTYVCYVEVT